MFISISVAQTLWNNMLEPVGKKTMTYNLKTFPDLKCPTEQSPFLFTNDNSKAFLNAGRQL